MRNAKAHDFQVTIAEGTGLERVVKGKLQVWCTCYQRKQMQRCQHGLVGLQSDLFYAMAEVVAVNRNASDQYL